MVDDIDLIGEHFIKSCFEKEKFAVRLINGKTLHVGMAGVPGGSRRQVLVVVKNRTKEVKLEAVSKFFKELYYNADVAAGILISLRSGLASRGGADRVHPDVRYEDLSVYKWFDHSACKPCVLVGDFIATAIQLNVGESVLLRKAVENLEDYLLDEDQKK